MWGFYVICNNHSSLDVIASSSWSISNIRKFESKRIYLRILSLPLVEKARLSHKPLTKYPNLYNATAAIIINSKIEIDYGTRFVNIDKHASQRWFHRRLHKNFNILFSLVEFLSSIRMEYPFDMAQCYIFSSIRALWIKLNISN